MKKEPKKERNGFFELYEISEDVEELFKNLYRIVRKKEEVWMLRD